MGLGGGGVGVWEVLLEDELDEDEDVVDVGEGVGGDGEGVVEDGEGGGAGVVAGLLVVLHGFWSG